MPTRFILECEIYTLFCALTAFNLFLVSLSFEKFNALRTAEMKNPLLSQAMGTTFMKTFLKYEKIFTTAKIEKFLEKTAESCVNLIFLTTFAKKIKN